MSEPATKAGWAAILAAILLPTIVAAGFALADWSHRAREAARTAELEARILGQERTIADLRQQVQMLEEDLDSVIEFD